MFIASGSKINFLQDLINFATLIVQNAKKMKKKVFKDF